VSYHYDNADAASSGTHHRTIGGTALTSGPSLLPVNNADWRGVRHGAVAGTAVGGVSYFYAIVAAALSGMSY